MNKKNITLTLVPLCAVALGFLIYLYTTPLALVAAPNPPAIDSSPTQPQVFIQAHPDVVELPEIVIEVHSKLRPKVILGKPRVYECDEWNDLEQGVGRVKRCEWR